MRVTWCNNCVYIKYKGRNIVGCIEPSFDHSECLFIRDDYNDGNYKYQPRPSCNGDYFSPKLIRINMIPGVRK
jgi:hypothetical protein